MFACGGFVFGHALIVAEGYDNVKLSFVEAVNIHVTAFGFLESLVGATVFPATFAVTAAGWFVEEHGLGIRGEFGSDGENTGTSVFKRSGGILRTIVAITG